MSVIGHSRDETVAVHLVKTYCLPILLYGCEAWSLSSSDMHKLNVAWNNCFRRILMPVSERVSNSYCFTAILCLFRLLLIKEKLYSAKE